MHLCAELIAASMALEPLGEVGAKISLQLFSLPKSIIKKLSPKINVKNIKNRVYVNQLSHIIMRNK